MVVLATGFAGPRLARPLDVRGRAGRELHGLGRGRPAAYLGITVPDFPNLFICTGRTPTSAHGGSIIFLGECQSRYITGGILLSSTGDVSLECRADVHDG